MLKHRCFRDVVLKTIYGVRVSAGGAETIVRQSAIRNNCSIVYSLSKISAQNYQNRLM